LKNISLCEVVVPSEDFKILVALDAVEEAVVDRTAGSLEKGN
jgi:hypothetical protein